MTTFRLASRVRAGTVPAPARVPVLARPSPVLGGETGPATDLAPSPQAAYPVPWRVTARSERGAIEVEHTGDGPLRSVRFTLAGGGLLGLSLPRTVHPGERLRVVLRGMASEGALEAPDAMLVLRWFQPDGRELLWPIAL